MNTNEIRFKVWDGNRIHIVKSLHYMVECGIRWFSGINEGWCQICKEFYHNNKNIRIDTLIRNTDIIDCNDKEVWEADIVRILYTPFLGIPVNYYGIVEPNNDGGWRIDLPNNGAWLVNNDSMIEIEEIEVIGNIYESPDMFDLDKMELLIGKGTSINKVQ